MCKFFSCISNGKGKVLFLTLEDIKKIENEGNKEQYDSWNSHTTTAHYFKVNEDKWNKWEYNPETKELKSDSLVTSDDREKVLPTIVSYLNEHGELYLQKIYDSNSGDRNSGNRNSGYGNSGNRNSGDWNSGDRNSGDSNSGYGNSGYGNSGDWNSGNRNSGNGNSGDWNLGNGNSGYGNSGDWNSGDRNSGDWNSGDRNSGDRNSGNRNSGDWNLGNGNSGFLNTNIPLVRIFNKETNVKREDIVFPNYFLFDLNIWVEQSEMTDEEKEKYGWYKTTDGFLRKIEYKEAWKLSFDKADKEDVAKTMKLPNFDYTLFEEITGITKEMINEKLKG